MRNVEISFSDLKTFLETRGVVFDEKEYIRDVHSVGAWPESIVFVSIDTTERGLDKMTTKID